MLMAFMGVPVGLLLARTKRYKWIYLLGYALATVATCCMVTFGSETPVSMGVLVTALAGLGMGMVPTLNTLVVQFAVPKRLLGVAIAAIFFVVALGNAITPAILGAAMNATYEKRLEESLPAELDLLIDKTTLASLADPRVLMSREAMAGLQGTLERIGDHGPALYGQTVQAIRQALEHSLKRLFLISAVAMLLSFLLIGTIPEVSMDVEVQDRRMPASS